jgi:hypothetical protein
MAKILVFEQYTTTRLLPIINVFLESLFRVFNLGIQFEAQKTIFDILFPTISD